MPGRNGIEATRAIVSAAPHIAVLVLTMHEDDESVFAARPGRRPRLPGQGRAPGRAAARDARGGRGRRRVRPGDRAPDGRLLRRGRRRPAPPPPFPELTAREREILDLVARGRSNAQIAEQLVLSTKTVRNHVSSVFTKIQVVDRAQAIVKAREAGIGGR